MSNITTEIEHLSISSLGINNHPLGSVISSGTIAQQSEPDNVESTTITAAASIRKWRWPKPSERRKKAVTLDTNTNTLPPAQTPSDWIWENEIPQAPSWSTTASSSSSSSQSQLQLLTAPDRSSPILSLTEGFEKYWEDISDEEMTAYIPSNIIAIWEEVIARKRMHAKAAGAEYERELEEELEERYGAMLRYKEEEENEAWSVEALLDIVEECDLFGWVREMGRRAFWEGNGVVRDGW
ncbi:uncharacterized protein EAE97_006707 [Botrytis byssoidea]|uniref:Uncharacterized protein n=1 Tax=Botrytis byssoidea TaxID=139641 RepID=A0A9P5II74_9HELO|nr:uncharacterized protein EAE97_006707 [Botrytis byssoidea]KAF7941870.1 hypothetical protein EAE97_006707 [Botrytis byssoidea]